MTSKFYYDTLQRISAEKKADVKLEIGMEIPEFFKLYTSKIGIKDIKNTSTDRKSEGSFENLQDFIGSLLNNKENKDERIKNFKALEPSWYTQELLSMIATKKLGIGIGNTKIETILNSIKSDDDNIDTYVMLASVKESKKNPVEYPAMVQVKYDGTRRLVFVTKDEIFYRSRQGKEGRSLPENMENDLKKLYESVGESFVLDGEFYIPGINRAESNGIANKKDISKFNDMVMAVWDFFPLELYKDLQELEKSLYIDRYSRIKKLLKKKYKTLEYAESWEVTSSQHASEVAIELFKQGEEGGVLKDYRLTFKNGRSEYCIKLKQLFDCNLQIVGLNEGTGKYKNMLGSFIAESSDGKLRVSVSGMSDSIRKEADESWVGEIINVTFLEVNKKNTEGYYTLHSPQFVRIEEDRKADSIGTIKKIASGTILKS